MRLLLLAVIPIGFSNIIGGQMLIPMGKEKKLFQAEAAGAVSNIIMNALLIPALSSAGAAIATTLSETLVTAVAMIAARRAVRFSILQMRNLLFSLAGCAAAGFSAWGITQVFDLPLFLKGPLSFLIFALLFCLMMMLFHDSLYSDLPEALKVLYRRMIPARMRGWIRGLINKAQETHYKMQAVLFPGRMKQYCPCCETKLRTFVAGGYMKHPELYDPGRYENTRQEVICPVCGSLPRHRILAEWCNDRREDLRSADILYFAPERSMMRWMKRNGISCTTADLFSRADLRIDIQATGLPEDAWDFIFCNHVLEHVEDFHAALEELHRILKPGGHLVCSFPMDPKIELLDEEKGEMPTEDRIKRFGQHDHKRVFGIHAAQLLTEAGFEVKVIAGEDCPESILPVVGPGDYDMNCLFDCRK